MAWSPWSKGNTESNPIRAQHHGVQFYISTRPMKWFVGYVAVVMTKIEWQNVFGAMSINIVVTYDVPDEWCCCECQNKSNWDQTPSQGGQTIRNRVHQDSLKIPNKFENAKVKYISYEEASLLNNNERPPNCRSNFHVRRTNSHVRPASPPNAKQSSSRSDNRAYSQFHRKFPNGQQSPCRSDTQGPFLKRGDGASQNQTEIAGINMKQKAQSGEMLRPCHRSRAIRGKIDFQVQNEQREKKVVSADKVTMNPQSRDDPREKSGSNVTGTDIGRGSEMSPDNDIGMLVVINSSVEYARQPPPEICWTGCFLVSNGSNCNPADFKAYCPSKVSSKVLNVIKSMPSIIELDILPRMDEWPKSFEINPPVYEDIGLFFFSTELDRNGKSQSHVMETSCNFVMRAYINNIKLLIYSSEVLPPDSQWIDGESYLWGVFVDPKRRHKSMPFGSISA
uniref:AIPP2-like SPOC-like domain-containing protein n=1 Tax=Oryza glumipatula TaxID=40148 RepID=A0A0D9Z909_9ORYZ